VTKNTRYETIIQRSYREMAEHYDTAIVPARVKAPDDKPNAEGSVKFATTWILAALRHYHFFTLDDAKTHVSKKLEELNNRSFTRRVGSRRLAYENEEREYMKPLPRTPYEPAVWSTAKIQNDYLVSDGINKYTVPFDLIGDKVDIRTTRNTVEAFYHGSRIASHVRKMTPQRDPIKVKEHMPLAHQKYETYNNDQFIAWAEQVGSSTKAVIEYFLYSEKEPEQGYKFCVGLIKRAEHYGNERIEKACERMLAFTNQPTLRNIVTILRNGQDMIPMDTIHHQSSTKTTKKRKQGITRGADSFKIGGDES